MFPSSGPMAMPPMGDISDGEEEEGLDAGIPMTKNEVGAPAGFVACPVPHSEMQGCVSKGMPIGIRMFP